MNKNWIILLLAFIFIIEYETGFSNAINGDSIRINYPVAVIKRGHNRKYIDLRRVKSIRDTMGNVLWRKVK